MRSRRAVGVALLALVLTACAGKSEQGSEVVATVDDSEINEQLLVSGALDSKLDNDPAVVQALGRARRQVLARAYMERVVFPREAISAAEQIEYYQRHPELFAKRQVFHMMAYTIRTSDLTDAVRRDLGSTRTVEEVSKVLAAHDLAYDVQSLNRGAEQLPLQDLPKLAAAKVGDVVILPPHEGSVTVMQILRIQADPISFDRARPIIQQYLVNARNAKALGEYLKQARAVLAAEEARDARASPVLLK